nr:calcitonin gene-related peptide type 1 receptor-like isoform X3 [Halyomorpha halys]
MIYTREEIDNITAQIKKECFAVAENYTEGLFCPREFDGWTCLNATPAGTVLHFPCPYFQLGFDPKRTAHRPCLENGTWFRHPETNKPWSNYTTCVDLEDFEMRNQVNFIYKAGYMISLAALLLSLFIFFYFRSLTCTRIQIHKNFFISLAINNLLWLIWYEAVLDNHTVIYENGVGCQILHVILQYFLVTTYFWGFCEGLYLYTLLVVTFLTESKVMVCLYLIGWGVPALIVSAYASLRISTNKDTDYCWIQESIYRWTLIIPVGLSMIANLIFLITIVRVVLTKLHAAQKTTPSNSFKDKNASIRSKRRSTVLSDTAFSERTKKAVRATLILIPLIGLQYVVMIVRPEQKTTWEYTYELTEAIVASSQGLCVALLFCFCNGEVTAAVRKKWRQCRLSKKRPWNSCSGVTSVSCMPPQDVVGKIYGCGCFRIN